MRHSLALAIILDMDGLMLDTEPISLRVWRQAAQDLGYLLDDGMYDRMTGLSQKASREMLLRCFGEDCPVDDLMKAAYGLYREALEIGGVPRKPGLLDFIGFLEEHQLPKAVATSTATNLATYKLRQAGVLQHFDVIVGGDQVSSGKPDPDIFLMAASRLRQRPEDCVVLEDSAPGVRGAVAAGMRVILVPDGKEPSDAARLEAYAVVESLSAATAVIERMIRPLGFSAGE